MSALFFDRFFSDKDTAPENALAWNDREATIKDESGKTLFKQTVHAPSSWSDQACSVVASKYFHGDIDKGNTPSVGGRESSVVDLVRRVADTIATWGDLDGYFSTHGDSVRFGDELAAICYSQYAAFNSPVWFNVGLSQRYGIKGGASGWVWDRGTGEAVPCKDSYMNPQASACFIVSVDDDMASILERAKTEGLLFKHGSGVGCDNSTVRSTREKINGGGKPSGPLSFIRIYDSVAGSIKSGGKTRRAARMDTLKVSHPDIMEFIRAKANEDRKARILVDGGISGGMNGEAAETVAFQNCNMSVRVTDAFLRAVEAGEDWQTVAVTTGSPDGMPKYPARDILMGIAEGTWICGDPGIQYHDTIQRWHTSPNSGEIASSNPCSEYIYINDSACNLASLNLIKFVDPDGKFNVPKFRHAVRILFTAMDILVSHANYPTKLIAENSHRFRPLGLGPCGVGALLMAAGLPYDSDEGRSLAGAVTAILHGEAALHSARMAANPKLGPFAGYAQNRDPFLKVMGMHQQACWDGQGENRQRSGKMARNIENLWESARLIWSEAIGCGHEHGFRNGQLSVCAPTGTIAFMMDSGEFTGIEPGFSLIQYKTLSGGGMLKIINRFVRPALIALGYSGEPGTIPDVPAPFPSEIDNIIAHIEKYDTVEDVSSDFSGTGQSEIIRSGLRPEHLAVFDCASPPRESTDDDGNRYRPTEGRSIAFMGHLKMMGALQPFLSGAISKCITGDSIISTSRGLMRIGSLYNGEESDTFRDIDDLFVPTGDGTQSIAKQFYHGGIRPTWKITLADGRILTGTAPHRLRVATPNGLDWKAMPDLVPGDFVGIALGSECWGETSIPSVELTTPYGSQNAFRVPSEVTEELALFLGMLTADGHISESNYVIGFTKDDESCRTKFKELLNTLFGLRGRDYRDVRREGGPDGFTGVEVGSKSLMQWLKGIGFSKKNIPDIILGSSKEIVLAYLSGLYLDGYITKIDGVSISQKNHSLLRDVQLVWDNMGIATYFTTNTVNGINYPVLHAMAFSRKLMADSISWIEPHKIDRASRVVDGEDRRSFPMYRRQIESLIRELHRTQEFRSIFDKRTITLGREYFLKTADAIGFPINKEERNLYYVPVASIEYAGEQQVFDLSVPGPESFVANGIVNHNTCNLPESATVEDIYDAYLAAWRLGIKAVAIYRDGSKESQPVSTSKLSVGGNARAQAAGSPSGPESSPETLEAIIADRDQAQHDAAFFRALAEQYGNMAVPTGPIRKRLPDTRLSITHKFSIDGTEGYFTVGIYADTRQPAELFVEIAKEGSTLAGVLGAWATCVSLMLQYGIPLGIIVAKFSGHHYEPSGFTKNPALIPKASSLIDYIVRWLGLEFLPDYRELAMPPIDDRSTEPVPFLETVFHEIPPKFLPAEGDGINFEEGDGIEKTAIPVAAGVVGHLNGDKPVKSYFTHSGNVCQVCGGRTQPNGANCWVCTNCATPTGGCG